MDFEKFTIDFDFFGIVPRLREDKFLKILAKVGGNSTKRASKNMRVFDYSGIWYLLTIGYMIYVTRILLTMGYLSIEFERVHSPTTKHMFEASNFRKYRRFKYFIL